MNTMTSLIRLSLLALLTVGLSACGGLVPVQVTETIKIDQTNTAIVKLEGEFIDLFPFIEVAQKTDVQSLDKFPIKKNAELKQEIAIAIMKNYGEYIISQKDHRYQVAKTSSVRFPTKSHAENFDKLENLLSKFGTLCDFYLTNDSQSRVVLMEAIDLTELRANHDKQTQRIIEAQQRLLSKGSYKVIIETDQSVLFHNAQKTQPLPDGKRTRYEWQFNYADVFKPASDGKKKDLWIKMVLSPAVEGSKKAEGE